jgi:hypothetical protein
VLYSSSSTGTILGRCLIHSYLTVIVLLISQRLRIKRAVPGPATPAVQGLSITVNGPRRKLNIRVMNKGRYLGELVEMT